MVKYIFAAILWKEEDSGVMVSAIPETQSKGVTRLLCLFVLCLLTLRVEILLLYNLLFLPL